MKKEHQLRKLRRRVGLSSFICWWFAHVLICVAIAPVDTFHLLCACIVKWIHDLIPGMHVKCWTFCLSENFNGTWYL
jgi:hypothetical protein